MYKRQVQNTAESIAAAMLRFISEPGFLAARRAAAQTMRQGLTWDAVATQYLTLYERLLGRRAATTADYPERGRRAAGQGDFS